MDIETFDFLNKSVVCYSETIYRTNGVWEGPDPLTPILPIFILQLAVAILATRLLLLIQKLLLQLPLVGELFNQPPFVFEILGGILLGPSMLGRIQVLRKFVFPTYSFTVLEPMAHLALVYYAFLMGLEMDIRALSRTSSKARNVAVSGIIIPFAMGSSLFYLFPNNTRSQKLGFIYWGAALSVTGFSALARILEKRKILHTEAGKTTVTSALVTDFFSWVLLALAVPISTSGYMALWPVAGTAFFVIVCVKGVRLGLAWLIRRTPEGQGFSEFYLCFILSGVALCGVCMDVIGTHPMIGAFVFGLVIPNVVLEATLLDKLEDFVLKIFMPVFFAVCGLRTNIGVVGNNVSAIIVVLVIVLVWASKVLSTVAVSMFCNMARREALAVGVLSSTKSIMAMIILEIGQEQGALTTQTYTVMVIAILLMTVSVTPLTMLYQPKRNVVPYKRRTIQKSKPDEELRILTCIHGMRNVLAIINLLEASNATQKSPISVFALHLVELIGRASATLVVHNSRKAGPRNPSQSEAQTEHIISAFDNYELRCDGVSVQALTGRYAYSSMHDDICGIAKEKRASLVILPFHRLQNVDGEMEDINPAIRSVNESVLANAPCSVGILIDRGLAESRGSTRRVAMIYLGGPDDREALAYTWRMSQHPQISLAVIRFSPGKDTLEIDPMEFMGQPHGGGVVAVHIDEERERVIDDDYLGKFQMATENENSILFSEVVLNDEEETVRAIKSMDGKYDLFVVGKGRGVLSPLTVGLADWCDCPELGAIGDLLVTSEFSSAFSVLVVQQYMKAPTASKDGSVRSGGSIRQQREPMEEEPLEEWRPSSVDSDAYGSFGHRERDHMH